MGLFNQDDNEKEMSGGAMFGYALIGFVVIVILIFGIFAATKLIGGKKSDSDSNKKPSKQIEKQVDKKDVSSIYDEYTFSI